MLTRLRIRNFKAFEDVDIPLGQNVVFVGANNSGKTSALQALALWRSGLDAWTARRIGGSKATKRPGVTMNRRMLTHTPVAESRLLWRGRRVNIKARENGSQDTQPVFLDLIVDGETNGVPWSCGLEFNHINAESISCRPLRLAEGKSPERMEVPEEAVASRLALLPPMSGLAAEEPEIQPGRIDVLLGEGQTAQVLRNLCLRVYQSRNGDWDSIVEIIKASFGVVLGEPIRDPARGTVELKYEQNGVDLDLPSAGRGMQQVLLLLAHLHANEGSTLLLDEPDAHLEIIRQRQVYDLLTEAALRSGSQVIAASHSEVVLNEAGDRDVLVAFVGKPHRIDDRGSQTRKALTEIGFDQYMKAELKGWVLYLEGSTDLQILKTFAKTLGHKAFDVLDRAFAYYVQNQPKKAESHFYGLREAKPDLRGLAIFDRLQAGLPSSFNIQSVQWRRREIENYLCTENTLMRYAKGQGADDLILHAESARREQSMRASIAKVAGAMKTLGEDPWSIDTKVSDKFLPAVFQDFFASLNLDNAMQKSDFHILAAHLEPHEIDREIVDALDAIVRVAAQAKPGGE